MFISIMNDIKTQILIDRKCHDAFSIILPNDYVTGYDYSIIYNSYMNLIKKAFNDNHRDSWIDYFMYELNFGEKYYDGCAKMNNGTIINLSSASTLYDYLIQQNVS